MRYRYFNVFSGRMVFIILIVLLLSLFLFHSCNQVSLRQSQVIGKNVFFAGKNLGGLTPQEAETVLTRLADEKKIPAVDAFINPETKGVIPDLNGVELDVVSTLEEIVSAKHNTDVEPVFREVPAAITRFAFRESPVYQGNPAKQQVTFLINVAWGNEYLTEMLDVLQQEDAQATFFVVGRWVRNNQESAKLIANAGFEMANHGDSDAINMASASFEQALQDIQNANDTIEQLTGKRPDFYSPHKGELNDDVLKAAAQEECQLILWTVDTVDWMLPGVDVMVEKILTHATGGSLILMHPTEQTADFLRQVIPELRRMGLEPVSLSALLSPTRQDKGVNVH